jgi:hypothetical protein
MIGTIKRGKILCPNPSEHSLIPKNRRKLKTVPQKQRVSGRAISRARQPARTGLGPVRPNPAVGGACDHQATSPAPPASTSADFGRSFRPWGVERTTLLRCDASTWGWGRVRAVMEMSIDSPRPFCYSTQFAKCAGSLLRARARIAIEGNSEVARRLGRRTPLWQANPCEGANSNMAFLVAR